MAPMAARVTTLSAMRGVFQCRCETGATAAGAGVGWVPVRETHGSSLYWCARMGSSTAVSGELSAESSPKDAPGSPGVSLSDATEHRRHTFHTARLVLAAQHGTGVPNAHDSPRRVAQIGTSRARGSFRPPGLSGEAARSRARYDGREQSGSEPFGGVMDRLTKSYPVFDCDAHINDPRADLGLRPGVEEGAGAQHLLAGRRARLGSTATRR